MANNPLVLCDNLVKIYKVADLEVVALQGLDLEIPAGEIMALVGPSGAGKSTLLNLLGGLDTPSAGALTVAGADLLKMGEADRVRYKRETVGFVWQQPARNLLPYLSARENVELPMLLSGVNPNERRKRALELLDMVMLADRANFRPDRLSGGQQQRVALAIALANHPPLLLGDELTGQVDSESANEIFTSLRLINKQLNTTIIIVTHDPSVAAKVDRVVAIRDGRTSTEVRRTFDHLGKISEEEWVILDGAGRLQLPKPYVEKLDMRERVKVRIEPDHVSVWPQRAAVPGEGTGREEKKGEGQVWKPPTMKTFLQDFDPYGGEARTVGTLTGNGDPAHTGTPTTGKEQARGAEIRCEHVSRSFFLGGEEVHACQDISLEIPAGTLACLKGRSGSGKTTLLNLIAGLDEPTGGTVFFNGQAMEKMSAAAKIDLRRRALGFVYQTFGLLPYLSAGENVEVPLRLVRAGRKVRQARVEELLGRVGLGLRKAHRTYELSGGEQQRVAIARALVNEPALILADEPTGQLDSATGASIIALLRQIVAETGVTVVIASHDPKVHEAADVVFELKDGRLVG
ncbi:MAG: ABC transporter ATP-binding protein [Anaerolineales bacterium]|nr:ABC transporter ATP-binding protein [Anaerolineales bacterium]